VRIELAKHNLPCPAKQAFVPSVLTEQANFAMQRIVPQRVANRCSRRRLINSIPAHMESRRERLPVK